MRRLAAIAALIAAAAGTTTLTSPAAAIADPAGCAACSGTWYMADYATMEESY